MHILAESMPVAFPLKGLGQHARLVTLTSVQERSLPETLMVDQFDGREAISGLFRFEIDALSVSTDLELSIFIGEELTIGLLQPDGSRRAWHGLCTHCSWLGADGGVARYRLRLEPALSLLKLRRDCYIFQDKNVQEIVTELLADYAQVRFEFDVTQELERRAIVTQYRESDYEFLVRVLASEGLSWRFEHDQLDAHEETHGDGQARHRVVIFDRHAQVPPTRGDEAIRFHAVRATECDDAIDEFRPRRQLQANAVTISSWDPCQLMAPSATQQSGLDAGDVPELALYDGSGERLASDAAIATPHSELMLQALEMANKSFEGAGSARRLAAGHGFILTQHDHYAGDESRFTVLWVRHQARNNFQAQIKGGADHAIDAGTYCNQFGCVRHSVAIVPQSITAPAPATALGPQTALVVGLPDAACTTMRDHQVKVQFAWQRGANPNAGGMAHNTGALGNAPGDDTSGTWIRVAEALAGPNWGSQFTPRVGSEVLVDFIEGDVDRPMIVAQLYTGSDLPPFSAGIDSAANHGGTLSGMHSHNHDGSGFNQWQLDDTAGQVRTRLATSTAASQLNLGYLVAQSPGSSQRGSYRGSGFELRSDAWAVVRGGDGVLLTTAARAQQGSSVVSTQMDAAEAAGLLDGAGELAERLRQSASEQKALASSATAEAHREFIAQIDPGQKGKHSAEVGGQEPFKTQPGGRDLDQSMPAEKFGAPVVLMTAAASINWATPASTMLFAGEHLQWTTQSDFQLTAQHTVSAVAAHAAGLYTHSGGIQAIAGNGAVSLQAHTDQLEILADQAVTIVSVNDCIEIQAKEKIVVQAGTSSITLEGGDITFACPGNFTVKGAQHTLDDGGEEAAQLAGLPRGAVTVVPPGVSLLENYDEQVVFKDADGQHIGAIPFRLFNEADDTQQLVNKTDALSELERITTPQAETLQYALRYATFKFAK
ncbi:type VI secretion system tip protein VgrG [Massilia sp. PAMC28688]|uniref:type VI secretion system Vgr family protein n=1 Tax=Massilia sp. PAMC28688 TaxID=2861283 RepID=UPI001C63458B|nr:type VI secretion system Vgr family protein [Massilia sp. PAMC28688]QYF94434.1 type VI secretion system tip protein VgrG [Massilia sp. PAMC28688]